MFTNLFGNYLIENEVINTEQYSAIKAAEAKTRVKLGLIAVAEKLMTQQQADAVNERQAILDRRFGDIAEEMGLLTRAQVKRLLSNQGNPYLQFMQVVSDLGIMTVDEVADNLEKFRQKMGFTSMDMDAIKSGDIDRIIPLLLPEDMSWNCAEHIAVIIRTLNRLACDDFLYKTPVYIEEYNPKSFAFQRMSGGYEASVLIAGSDEGMLLLAEGFAKDSFGSIGLEALDSIAEFINICNGLFATMISQDMIEATLFPPYLSEEEKKVRSKKMVMVPLELKGNPLHIVVSLGSEFELE